MKKTCDHTWRTRIDTIRHSNCGLRFSRAQGDRRTYVASILYFYSALSPLIYIRMHHLSARLTCASLANEDFLGRNHMPWQIFRLRDERGMPADPLSGAAAQRNGLPVTVCFIRGPNATNQAPHGSPLKPSSLPGFLGHVHGISTSWLNR